MDSKLELGFSKDDLKQLVEWEMPFGKYAGTRLIELPEAYLFWFDKNEFPKGELGRLMKLALSLKVDGVDGVLKPMVGDVKPKN